MSWYCIHERRSPGSWDEPPESWCELDGDCCCDECPNRYSREDYEGDLADLAYDRYVDSLVF